MNKYVNPLVEIIGKPL